MKKAFFSSSHLKKEAPQIESWIKTTTIFALNKGYSEEEISSILQISLNHVKKFNSLAKQKKNRQ